MQPKLLLHKTTRDVVESHCIAVDVGGLYACGLFACFCGRKMTRPNNVFCRTSVRIKPRNQTSQSRQRRTPASVIQSSLAYYKSVRSLSSNEDNSCKD